MPHVAIHEHPLGMTWVMDEPYERTSHGLADDGRVWLIDPVDDSVAIERAQGLGDIAGVIQLLDRHNRDCAELAKRFGVGHLVNPAGAPDLPFEVFTVFKLPKWRETAIWWPQHRGLVVSEALIAGGLAGDQDCAVHPMVALIPPKRRLRRYEPEHLLVGHGAPLHGSAANEGMRRALRRSRRDAPKAVISMFRGG